MFALENSRFKIFRSSCKASGQAEAIQVPPIQQVGLSTSTSWDKCDQDPKLNVLKFL